MAPELRVLIAPELRVAHRELGEDQHARVRARVVLVDARGVGRAGVAAEGEAALVLLAHHPLVAGVAETSAAVETSSTAAAATAAFSLAALALRLIVRPVISRSNVLPV